MRCSTVRTFSAEKETTCMVVSGLRRLRMAVWLGLLSFGFVFGLLTLNTRKGYTDLK